MNYLQRLDCLGLWTLEERRNRSDIIELFRLYECLTTIPFECFFSLDTTRQTREHSLKISKHSCTKDIRKYFFSNRVINRWNSLPDHIVQASSINVFKNGLQKMRSSRMGFFMDNRCSLTLEVVFWLQTSVLDRRQVRLHLVSNLVSRVLDIKLP